MVEGDEGRGAVAVTAVVRGVKEWEAVEMHVHAAKSTAEPQSLGVIKR